MEQNVVVIKFPTIRKRLLAACQRLGLTWTVREENRSYVCRDCYTGTAVVVVELGTHRRRIVSTCEPGDGRYWDVDRDTAMPARWTPDDKTSVEDLVSFCKVLHLIHSGAKLYFAASDTRGPEVQVAFEAWIKDQD